MTANARRLAAEMRTRAFDRAMDEATREPWKHLAGMPDPRHPVVMAIETFTPIEGYFNSGMLELSLAWPAIRAMGWEDET